MSNEFRSVPLIIVWEFRPRPEKRTEFEHVYGPGGAWAQLFRQSPQYIRTELHRNPSSPGSYLKLDFWQSESSFENFKQQNAASYKTLDESCTLLSEEERLLGHCESQEQARSLLAVHGLQLPTKAADIHVRNGGLADIPAMVSLALASPSAAHWPAKTYEEMLGAVTPVRTALIAENDQSALCGFAVARFTGNECELENIVVRQDRQLGGIGRKLLLALFESARAKRAAKIFLEVRELNYTARALYERCGFIQVSRRIGYYTNPAEDARVYQFQLE